MLIVVFLAESWFNEECNDYCKPAVDIQQGELIFNTCWYPHMNSNDPPTCW